MLTQLYTLVGLLALTPSVMGVFVDIYSTKDHAHPLRDYFWEDVTDYKIHTNGELSRVKNSGLSFNLGWLNFLGDETRTIRWTSGNDQPWEECDLSIVPGKDPGRLALELSSGKISDNGDNTSTDLKYDCHDIDAPSPNPAEGYYETYKTASPTSQPHVEYIGNASTRK